MMAPRLRVLIVDDSGLQRQFLRSLLEEQPMDFLEAPNGAEAIAMASHHLPDIILLDIEMPVMDGIEAATRLRHDPRTADIPIIMVTSRADAEYMESAFVGGCSDYVTKPVLKPEILAKIASLSGNGMPSP